MRWLGILTVLAYRLLVRPFRRRQCLFPESCSAYGIRLLRQRGLVAAAPTIRARIRSCRLPASACFVLDATGRATLLAASGHDGAAAPPLALELLAHHAETLTIGGHD